MEHDGRGARRSEDDRDSERKKSDEFVGNQPAPPRKQWFEPVRGPRPDSGYIGLQNHNPRDTVYFREVSVKK